jgi:hypothetical protein
MTGSAVVTLADEERVRNVFQAKWDSTEPHAVSSDSPIDLLYSFNRLGHSAPGYTAVAPFPLNLTNVG